MTPMSQNQSPEFEDILLAEKCAEDQSRYVTYTSNDSQLVKMGYCEVLGAAIAWMIRDSLTASKDDIMQLLCGGGGGGGSSKVIVVVVLGLLDLPAMQAFLVGVCGSNLPRRNINVVLKLISKGVVAWVSMLNDDWCPFRGHFCHHFCRSLWSNWGPCVANCIFGIPSTPPRQQMPHLKGYVE